MDLMLFTTLFIISNVKPRSNWNIQILHSFYTEKNTIIQQVHIYNYLFVQNTSWFKRK